MIRYSSRPPPIVIPSQPRKFDDSSASQYGQQLSSGGLSPDPQDKPPVFPTVTCSSPVSTVSQIGHYILTKPLEDNATYQAVNVDTQEQYICKVFSLSKYRENLSPYWLVDSSENIQEIQEVILGSTNAYVFFDKNVGDLHSYIRSKRCLKEREARSLFKQVLLAVKHCHDSGVILRDLKLRKFAFTNLNRTCLRLEGLEDARVLAEVNNDTMSEKHGCPAYVSPEILNSDSYSGKAADMWSVGVILYTMLFGRYPFHDTEPRALFDKIRNAQYLLPDSVSSRAKCLLRTLLRFNPSERLTADEALQHPWFNQDYSTYTAQRMHQRHMNDQMVPDIDDLGDALIV